MSKILEMEKVNEVKIEVNRLFNSLNRSLIILASWGDLEEVLNSVKLILKINEFRSKIPFTKRELRYIMQPYFYRTGKDRFKREQEFIRSNFIYSRTPGESIINNSNIKHRQYNKNSTRGQEWKLAWKWQAQIVNRLANNTLGSPYDIAAMLRNRETIPDIPSPLEYDYTEIYE
jgi:hypothetical protein